MAMDNHNIRHESVKPWDATPGKVYRGTKSEKQIKKDREAKKNFDKSWDRIFGEKKLNIADEEEDDKHREDIQG